MMGRWRRRALIAVGALLLALTAAGLVSQQRAAQQIEVIVFLAQGALYLAAVWLIVRGGQRPRLAFVLGVAALMRCGVLLAPPYLSDDLYRYVWDGRVAAAGINPYRYVPSDTHLAPLRDAAIYPHVNRKTYAPTIYPPVAEYIFLATSRLSESAGWMKVTMVGFDLASVGILLRLLALSALPPERILIYAWHPLILWEFSGSGHIDAAVVTFVALALWARRREAGWLAGLFLGCAALVKFFPVVIFPALYRRWDWRMPAAAVGVAILAYLPFLGAGSAVFGFLSGYVAEEGLGSGAGFFLWNLVNAGIPLAHFGVLPYLAFAAAILAALAAGVVFSDLSEDRFIAAAGALAVAFTVLLSPHFAWYFAWIVPFLCVAPSPAALYLSVASLLLYLISGGPDLDGSRMLIEAFIYGPFAVLAALEITRWRANAGAPALVERQA
jgi:alpha-1,6-mannosyltransferase